MQIYCENAAIINEKIGNKTTLACGHLVPGMTLQAVLWIIFPGVLVIQVACMGTNPQIAFHQQQSLTSELVKIPMVLLSIV